MDSKELTPNEILRLVAENEFGPLGPNDRCYIPDVGPDALIAYTLDGKYAIVVDDGIVSVAENDDYGTTSWAAIVGGSENYRKLEATRALKHQLRKDRDEIERKDRV